MRFKTHLSHSYHGGKQTKLSRRRIVIVRVLMTSGLLRSGYGRYKYQYACQAVFSTRQHMRQHSALAHPSVSRMDQ